MRSARRCSGGRGGRSRRRRWRSGVGSCWAARQASPTSRWPPSWGCGRRRWASGGGGSSSRRLDGLADEPRPGAPRKITDEQVEEVIVATLERQPRRRHALVAGVDGGRDRVVEVDGGPDLEGVRAQAAPGRHVQAVATTRSSSTRSATWSACTWTRRRRRWCCAWTRSPRSRRWTARRRCCR